MLVNDSHGDFRNTAAISQSLKRVLAAAPNWADMSDIQREAIEMVAVRMGQSAPRSRASAAGAW